MRCRISPAALALAAVSAAGISPVFAHVVAGSRVFPVTLTFDDPGVNDEVSLPSFTYSRSGADGGSGPMHEVDLGFEFDKTITSNTALILNEGSDIMQTNGSKTQTGWENLYLTGKWQAYTNADHEFVVSLGVIEEIGNTGTNHDGADAFGSTAPTMYFGKGLGDLPIGYARPLAVTGELSYAIADKELKYQTDPTDSSGSGGPTGFTNNGNNNAWSGGISLQYSIPYLQSQVKDLGLPDFVGNLVPLVEFTWSSPSSSPSNVGTTWIAAPGVIYLTGWGELGLEATIPLNRASGSNVGAVGLVHFFLDDLMPDTLGKPLIN